MSNSGFGSGSNMGNTGGNTGTGNTGTGITTGPGNSGTGSSFGSGSSGSSMGGGTGGSMGGGTGTGGAGTSGGDFSTSSGFNTQSASDAGTCPHCGQAMGGGGLENFLGRLGITTDMISNLKGQFQNVDIDEYLNTAREYLKDGTGKATTYAKENPAKVAAGVAALALGAGLIYAAVNRDKA